MMDTLQLPQPQPFMMAHRVARYLVWVCITELIIIGALCLTIVRILPLKEKEVQLVEFQSGGNNFVRIVNANKTLYTDDVLRSVSLRDYVVTRETVDKITEEERIKRIRFMSSPTVFENFKITNREMIVKEGFKRSIEIVRDTQVGPNIHSVEFKTVDLVNGHKRFNTWKAYLRFQAETLNDVPFEDRLINPTGLYVTEYHVSREN